MDRWTPGFTVCGDKNQPHHAVYLTRLGLWMPRLIKPYEPDFGTGNLIRAVIELGVIGVYPGHAKAGFVRISLELDRRIAVFAECHVAAVFDLAAFAFRELFKLCECLFHRSPC
jgi:hypothetical protein